MTAQCRIQSRISAEWLFCHLGNWNATLLSTYSQL